jgi:hypothetical protein
MSYFAREQAGMSIVERGRTFVCDIAEETLDYALTSGRTVLVEDAVLLKTYGRKPLAVGVDRKEISGGEIRPGTWYRLLTPRELPGHLQARFDQGERRLSIVGATGWEEVREVGDLRGWGIKITRKDFIKRADEEAARVKSEFPVVVVDLSSFQGGSWQSNVT